MNDLDRYRAYLRLLESHIQSIEEVDVIIAVRASATPPTVPVLARQLDMPEGEIASAIDRLTQTGLAQRDGDGYVIGPANPATNAGLRELSRLVETDRLGVVNQLSANAIARLRSSAMRAFGRVLASGRRRF